MNRNYNSSPDELLLELSGLVPYLSELITFVDMMSYKDGIDYSNIKDIIISAVMEKNVTELLKHKSELKSFTEFLEVAGIASYFTTGISSLEIIYNWDSENVQNISINIDIPLTIGTYIYSCTFDKENRCKVIKRIMDSYTHFRIDGLELL